MTMYAAKYYAQTAVPEAIDVHSAVSRRPLIGCLPVAASNSEVCRRRSLAILGAYKTAAASVHAHSMYMLFVPIIMEIFGGLRAAYDTDSAT